MTKKELDKERSVVWARKMLKDRFLVLDTETTGLGRGDEIVQIAIIDSVGAILLDTLVKPTIRIPEDASYIHGITDQMVESAPGFGSIYEQIVSFSFSKIIIYNADYDMRLIEQSRLAACPELKKRKIFPQCAMKRYAAYIGELSRLPYRDYKWQKLPGCPGRPAHGAVNDCFATLELVKKMAQLPQGIPGKNGDTGPTITLDDLNALGRAK